LVLEFGVRKNLLEFCIIDIYYYLDSRYDINNRDVNLKEIKPTIEKLINFEIQNFIADLFAEKFSGRKEYFISSSKEVDFIITKRNKPIIVGEVKWKKITKNDINKFLKSSEFFNCKKFLVCKKGTKNDQIEVLDAKNICSES
jgi:hypothetical protein